MTSDTRARWLAGLGDHLIARKPAILKAWRECVDADPKLTASDALPRAQFNDHIPNILDVVATRMRAGLPAAALVDDASDDADAQVHGRQRWQQGYHLQEVALEWAYLQRCLLKQVREYAARQPPTEPAVLHDAYIALTELCSDGVCESTAQYFNLQQAEAAGHVRDLEETLAQVRTLERTRGDLWRQAAHDLRGNVGVVANAAAGLSLTAVPESARERLFEVLFKNVAVLTAMLDDIMSLARIQAGQEALRIVDLDAARVLREMCEGFEPLARERGLYLRSDGDLALPVQGDAIKIRRIAQNLTLNALRYTDHGGVTVTWGASRVNDPDRWMLTVQDTGPGVHGGRAAPIADALEQATHEAAEMDGAITTHVAGDERRPEAQRLQKASGEGVGLSIVKRLCDMLDASVELDTDAERGTMFRVLFPRRYGTVSDE